MDVSRPPAAAADQHQMAVAHLAVERLRRQPVAQVAADLLASQVGRLRGLAGRGEQLVRRSDVAALRIEQRPEQVHEPLAQGTQERRDGDVPPVGRAHLPAARQGQRVPQRRFVGFVQAPARIQRRAGELYLHLQERPDLGEAFGEQGHGTPHGGCALKPPPARAGKPPAPMPSRARSPRAAPRRRAVRSSRAVARAAAARGRWWAGG